MEDRLWTWKAVRLRVAVMVALALTIEGLMRSNLNMAIVCMVSPSHLEPPRSFNSTRPGCPILTFSNVTNTQYKGTLEWSSADRTYLFPVFYFGGLVATLSSEFLNRKFGASRTVLYGAIVNVAGTMGTPWVAVNLGPTALSVVRFVLGFGQGVLWPCMLVLVAQWFPVYERSTALAIATTGNQLSVILSMFITAELCQLPIFGGWPSAFYIYGILGIFLCMLWWMIVDDSPAHSRAVSDEERAVIGGVVTASRPEPQRIRWGDLLSSSVVWSISGASFCHNFVVCGISSYLPYYYKSALNMSLTSNGLLSSLPFICQFFSKVVFAGFADVSKKRSWMSVTAATKTCNTSASFGIATGLIVLSLCDCSTRWLAVGAVCTAMAFISGYIPGYSTSVVCVAPSQTPGVAAISRFWAQVGMSISPWLIGIVVSTGDIEEWRIIFSVMAIMCVVTGVFFQLCGSASIQPWNDAPHTVERREELLPRFDKDPLKEGLQL